MNVWIKAIEYIQDNVTFLPPEVLINYLESKYTLTEKSELALRSIDKYKSAFDNDFKTDEKVCRENRFGERQLEKAKFEFWNSKELDEEITLKSFQDIQRHFLNWCRKNKDRIKSATPAKSIQPTLKEIEKEEKPKLKYAESEAEYLWKESMQKQFKVFKETGILSPYSPSMQYKLFLERGLIEDNFKSFQDKAAEIIVAQKKQARIQPTSKFHLDSLNDCINRIQNGKLSDSDRSEIAQQAKLLSIETYYTNIKQLRL